MLQEKAKGGTRRVVKKAMGQIAQWKKAAKSRWHR